MFHSTWESQFEIRYLWCLLGDIKYIFVWYEYWLCKKSDKVAGNVYPWQQDSTLMINEKDLHNNFKKPLLGGAISIQTTFPPTKSQITR